VVHFVRFVLAHCVVGSRDLPLRVACDLPFRIFGIAVTGVLGFLSALLLLPVRLLRGPRAI